MKKKLITKLNKSIREARAFENLMAQSEKLKADLDFLAIMSDVEIPTEEDEIHE